MTNKLIEQQIYVDFMLFLVCIMICSFVFNVCNMFIMMVLSELNIHH